MIRGPKTIKAPAEILTHLGVESEMARLQELSAEMKILRIDANNKIQNNPLALILAEGVARQKGVPNEDKVSILIDENGDLIIFVNPSKMKDTHMVIPEGTHYNPCCEVPLGINVIPKAKAGKKPSLGELKDEAKAMGVDISDIDGRQKSKIMERIEAAKKTKGKTPKITPNEVSEGIDTSDLHDIEQGLMVRFRGSLKAAKVLGDGMDLTKEELVAFDRKLLTVLIEKVKEAKDAGMSPDPENVSQTLKNTYQECLDNRSSEPEPTPDPEPVTTNLDLFDDKDKDLALGDDLDLDAILD